MLNIGVVARLVVSVGAGEDVGEGIGKVTRRCRGSEAKRGAAAYVYCPRGAGAVPEEREAKIEGYILDIFLKTVQVVS